MLRRTYPLPDEQVVVAPHGPYNHYGQADSTDHEGDFVFLYFGIIRPYKGVEDLVAAFERLPEAVRDTSRLVIVGETWEGWTAPLDAVATSPAKDRITVVNRYVDDAEVAAHFAAADAVVLPYRRSSSSGPLHIAMSAGLPVVVAHVGGLVEAAGDYAGVSFVPTQDPDALAAAMAELPARRGERFADVHSWEHTVDAYGELLERLGVPGLSGTASAGAPERRGA
jgi:glycosyltransferase involved in cell wall biosynthesis